MELIRLLKISNVSSGGISVVSMAQKQSAFLEFPELKQIFKPKRDSFLSPSCVKAPRCDFRKSSFN